MAKKKESCFSAGDMQDAQRDGYANGLAYGERTGGEKAVAEYRLAALEDNLARRQMWFDSVANSNYFLAVRILVNTLRMLRDGFSHYKRPKDLIAAVVVAVEPTYLSDDHGL